jgi:hypothetical protein
MQDKKLIKQIRAITKGNKYVPITNYIHVSNGNGYATNLEMTLHFDTDLPNGFYELIVDELVMVAVQPEEDFPISMVDRRSMPSVLTTGQQVSSKDILELSKCVAKDELRPAWNGIYFDREYLAATDAHILRRIDIGKEAIEYPFILPINPIVRNVFADYDEIYIHANKEYAELETPGYSLFVRLIDAKYPNYNAVIPDAKNVVHAYYLTSGEINEWATYQKAIATTCIFIKDNIPVLENIDTSTTKSFSSLQTAKIPDREADGLIMPIGITEDQGTFGFNSILLKQLIDGKNNIILGFSEANRALLVWFEPKSKPVKVKPNQWVKTTPKDVPTIPTVPTESKSDNSAIIKSKVLWSNY